MRQLIKIKLFGIILLIFSISCSKEENIPMYKGYVVNNLETVVTYKFIEQNTKIEKGPYTLESKLYTVIELPEGIYDLYKYVNANYIKTSSSFGVPSSKGTYIFENECYTWYVYWGIHPYGKDYPEEHHY